jgi:3-oxoacyl-[acyl-carrier protein] reductase
LRLDNKVALVTGGGRGIGKGVCLELANYGARVVVNSYTNSGEKVTNEINNNNGEAIFVKADVKDSQEVKSMVDTTIDKFGKIDILVNNAGIAKCTALINLNEEEWDNVIDTNLKGIYLCCKAVVKHMIDRKSGRIINVSSSAAYTGNGNVGTHYSASKGGIAAFTKTLARELGPYSITVNAIAPAYIETDMIASILADKNRILKDYTEEDYLKLFPLGRFGKPEDVGGAAVYLASDKAAWITGQTIHVNGGVLMY